MKKRITAFILAGTMILQSTVLVHAEELITIASEMVMSDTVEELVEIVEEEDFGYWEEETYFSETSTEETETEFIEDVLIEQVFLDGEEFYTEVSLESEMTSEVESEFKIEELDSAEMLEVYETYTSGDYTYILNDGEATITGYSGEERDLVIPEMIDGYMVTAIGDSAFRDNDCIPTSIGLPESLVEIGAYAFYNCRELIGDIVIPEGVTIIGEYAFGNCRTTHGKLELPDTLQIIGDHAFWACNGITGALSIPENVTTIGEYAFAECRFSEATLEISGTNTKIGANAFRGSRGLTGSLKITNGITEIEEYAFAECNYSNVTLELPNSLTIIHDYAFWSCNGITGTLKIPEGVTTIGKNAFERCIFSNAFLELPNTLQTIGEYAFADCRGLTGNLKIPSGITAIGNYVFYMNMELKGNLELPDTLQRIGSNAFAGCGFTGNLKLPTGVTEIGDFAFSGCQGLTGTLKIPEGVTTIDEYVFNGCKGLNGSLELPDSLQKIGRNAFSGCQGLTGTLKIPEGVTTIGEYAFSNCKGLNAPLELPDTLQTIGSYAFSNCSNLVNDLEIPSGVEYIGGNAFWGCEELDTITFLSANVPEINTLSDFFSQSKLPNLKVIYVPREALTLYKNMWGSYVPDTVEILYIGAQIGELDSTVDEYIISEVKKYTSDEMCAQYLNIMERNVSDEIKFKELNDFFRDYGITDVREGTKYLTDTSSYRSNYLYLTTNEIYCAFNFYEWLFSSKGTLARGLLYADGLIFNWEIAEWFNMNTYIEDEYPGMKKNKKMLQEFMEYAAPSFDVYQKANETASFLKNLITLNNLVEEEEMNHLMDKIIKCTSEEELEKLQKKFVDSYIIPQISGKKIYVNGEKFGKALKSASQIMSFIGATTDDILQIMNLSNQIALYQKYSNFLTTIYSCTDLSLDMRLAAHSLLKDIDYGYYNKLKDILGNAIKFVDEVMELDLDILNEFLEKAGGEGLKTLKLGVYISNIIIDTGDFVNQAAYTMGYAELSTLYSLILQADKQRFLAYPTADNAWTFFEDYTLLWALRANGEQQYLDMNSVKAFIFGNIKGSKYEMKKDMVKGTLQHLEKCKFEIAPHINIPASVQYVKKAVIHCPVNVEVYTQDGQLVASLVDGMVSDTVNEYGRFAVVYQPYNGEYEKVICQSTNDDLIINCYAVDEGEVDYQFASQTEDEQILCFDNVFVETGDVIEVDTKLETEKTYAVYEGGKDNEKEPVEELLVEKAEHEYVNLETISVSVSELELEIGDIYRIQAAISPTNASNQELLWSSSNEEVVSVRSGKLNAVGAGTATILVQALEAPGIQCEVQVNVKEKVRSIESAEVHISQQKYMGEPVEPVLVVEEGENTLVQEVDYTISYLNNATPGVATIIIKGQGKYFGELVKTFEIVCEHMKCETLAAKQPDCMNTGLTEGKNCSLCKEVLIKQEVIPMTDHMPGKWETESKATVFKKETQKRICSVCKEKETRTIGKVLTPTINVNATTLPLKVKQSTTGLKVSGLAAGDSIVSMTLNSESYVKISKKNLKTGTCTLTALKKKDTKATTKLTIKLASGLTKVIPIKVQSSAVKATRIDGVEKKLTMKVKGKMTLKPEKVPFTSKEKIKYSSSNKKVVKVSSKGVLTAVKPGTAKVTIKAGKAKFVCTITVQGIKNEELKNVPSALTVAKKKSKILKPVRVPSNSTDKITFKSSNKKVATVSAKGKITGKKKGTAKITVKCGSATTTCVVTVK